MDKSNESADSVLTLTVGFVLAYLVTLCWVINERMPPAELARDFATGYWMLRAAARAKI